MTLEASLGTAFPLKTTRKLPVASAEWAPGANPTMVAPITTASTTIEAKMDLPCMNPPFLCAGRDRAKTVTALRGHGQSGNARAQATSDEAPLRATRGMERGSARD